MPLAQTSITSAYANGAQATYGLRLGTDVFLFIICVLSVLISVHPCFPRPDSCLEPVPAAPEKPTKCPRKRSRVPRGSHPYAVLEERWGQGKRGTTMNSVSNAVPEKQKKYPHEQSRVLRGSRPYAVPGRGEVLGEERPSLRSRGSLLS